LIRFDPNREKLAAELKEVGGETVLFAPLLRESFDPLCTGPVCESAVSVYVDRLAFLLLDIG